MSVLVVGDPVALALAGAPEPADAPTLVVALGDAPFPDLDAERVRWRRTPADGGAERTIAPGGTGLWSRAPWPVRDELFELGPGAGALVLGPAAGALAAELRGRGVSASAAQELDAEALAAADVVVQTSAEAAGDVFAVLAAGRVLVSAAPPVFGLLPGVDHLLAEAPEHAADLTQAVLADPAPFAAMRVFGRIAADRHRASVAYPRLLA